LLAGLQEVAADVASVSAAFRRDDRGQRSTLADVNDLRCMHHGRPDSGSSRNRPLFIDPARYGNGVSASVFVSYSRSDRAYVERLGAHLGAGGVPVWYDADLTAGDRFGTVIQTQLDECAAVVAVRTPAAAASGWVDRELSYADARRKPLLPLLLQPCEPHVLLADLHYEDVTGDRMSSPAFTVRLRALVAAETFGGILDRTQVSVARLVAEGLADAEIARRLGLSERTILFHRTRVFAKLGISNRGELLNLLASRDGRSGNHASEDGPSQESGDPDSKGEQ
jgi:DNA-binding CsgD family transcriptional regulator